jgi:hypothetical protein
MSIATGLKKPERLICCSIAQKLTLSNISGVVIIEAQNNEQKVDNDYHTFPLLTTFCYSLFLLGYTSEPLL